MAQPGGGEAALADRYFADGEFEEALELYEKLNRRTTSENYVMRIVSCYEELGRYEDALKFMDRTIKRNSDVVIYPVMKAELLEKTGELKEADKLYEDIIRKELRSEGDFIRVGAYLYQIGKLDLARRAYEQGRKRLRSEYIFANEIANIYAQQGAWEAATQEFLNDYYANPRNLEKVNLDILNMVNPQSGEAIEKALLGAIDKENGDLGLRSILFEYYVLAENFFEAFMQVKSIDRLFREDGNRVFKFAETMRNNKRYDLSNKAYDYLIEKKKNSPYYFRAHMEKAINNELKAFEQIPVDVVAVREAVDTYEALFKEFGRSANYFDAIYRQAKLEVFYLDELEVARQNLEEVVKLRGVNPDDWGPGQAAHRRCTADAKGIRCGQAHLHRGDRSLQRPPNRGFVQVQAGPKWPTTKATSTRPRLAWEPSRTIPPMTSPTMPSSSTSSSWIIPAWDTTTVPLEMFAEAQLLVYQRDYKPAMALLDSLVSAYPTHGLTDEILWEKTKIFLRKDDIPTALDYIERILANHKEDIYGDDALYTKARIYDYNLKDPELAQKYYLEFLVDFPGSLYSVEVRKRIRQLRKEG
jgi:tetratricopeptide (TPR) repeat protein